MTKYIAAFLASVLTRIAVAINALAVPSTESVDNRVKVFAATLQAEAMVEDQKAEALREVAVSASIKSMNAARAANYRRDVAASVLEAGVY